MKKKMIYAIFVVGLLLVLILPLSVLAGEPQDVTFRIRNATGGPVGLKLTDAVGDITWIEVINPNFETTITEGVYDYYASTICGVESGVMNLTNGKRLTLTCPEQELTTTLYRIGNGWCDRCHNTIGYPLE